MLRLHQFSSGNAGHQDVLRSLRHAKSLQTCRVAEQGQVALVRIQGVRLRVRRQHHRIAKVGLAQRGAGGLSQIKICQAVVDEVDRQIAVPQHALTQTEISRPGDHGPQTVPLKQSLEQQELGVQVLLLGVLVDDRDAAQWPLMSAKRPLPAKHRHDALLKRIGSRGGRHQALHRRAAGVLCPRQHGV